MKKLIAILLAIALAAAAVFAIKHKKQQLAEIPPAKVYPLVVKTAVAEPKDGKLSHPYLALVQSDEDVKIATNIGGRVTYIASVGHRVKAGDKLITIDSTAIQSKLRSTQLQIDGLEAKKQALKSKLKSLQETHQRTQQLMKVQGASIEQFQKEEDGIKELQANIAGLEAQIAALESNLNALKQQLTYADVVSPVDGIISEVLITKGATAMPGKPLISLSTRGGKYLLVRTPNTQAKYAEYQGHICQLNPLNHTFRGMEEYTCHVPVERATGTLVDVNLITYQGKAIYLPLNGVLEVNHQTYAMVVNKDHAQKQPIKILASGVEGYAVEGLSAGQQYVIAKPDILLRLTTGQAIKVAQ